MDKTEVPHQDIYTKQLVRKKIKIPFVDFDSNIETYFKEYCKKNFFGKCSKEGYISYSDKVKIIEHSAPKVSSENLFFDVLFEFDVYCPCEDQVMYAIITNITKIGIKAVVSLDFEKNPVTVFISRLQNNHIVMDNNNSIENYEKNSQFIYREGDIIKFKVIGHRFEINDSSVYLLGEAIKDN